ncbi:MAG TPA: hypothetical protein VGF48_23135 [Thermoanaerobaculia bacterium]|jgi:transcriptional regulator with XRE-family HTH domain
MTGRALRSIRLALSLTVDEFSNRVGINAMELEAFERGDHAIEPRRLSAALERLTPDVEKLDTDNPLLPIPRLPLPKHADN